MSVTRQRTAETATDHRDPHRPVDVFADRHLGSGAEDIGRMLGALGVPSLDALIDQTIPSAIRAEGRLDLPAALTEIDALAELKALADKNEPRRSYLGLGYHGTVTPPVILRNIFENPGWYTQYTPYQAEIAQGRLEALLNFQTMVDRPHRPGDGERVPARRGDRRQQRRWRCAVDVLEAQQDRQRVLRRRTIAIRRRIERPAHARRSHWGSSWRSESADQRVRSSSGRFGLRHADPVRRRRDGRVSGYGDPGHREDAHAAGCPGAWWRPTCWR